MEAPRFFLRGIIGLLSFGALILPGSSTAADLKPGDKAPSFQLPGSDGKIYQLEDFLGEKAVVLAWFPKAFTGGCTAECKSIKSSGEVLRQFDVAYFTASCDTPELNREFAESLELDFPILSDPDKEVAQAYGVVNEDRRLPYRWTFFILPDGTIAEIDKDVKTRDHGKHIAGKLRELGISPREATSESAVNELSREEERYGWKLLFNGKDYDGWKNNNGKPIASQVEEESLVPYQSGGYVMVHKEQFGIFF